MIKEYKIDVIGTGGLSSQYSIMRNVLETAQKIKPEIICVSGGGLQ